VTPWSPAERTSFKAGDQLYIENRTRLYSHADGGGVLHRSSIGEDMIQMDWIRKKQAKTGMLRVQLGRRTTENSGRKPYTMGVTGQAYVLFLSKSRNWAMGRAFR